MCSGREGEMCRRNRSEVAILEFRYIIGSYIMHATTNGRCGLNSMMLATTWSKFLICPATSNASARNSPL